MELTEKHWETEDRAIEIIQSKEGRKKVLKTVNMASQNCGIR